MTDLQMFGNSFFEFGQVSIDATYQRFSAAF